MREAIQQKAVNACARILCIALALFALLFAAARAEYDGMLRVKLARLGSPGTLTMRANCDYALATDTPVRIPSGTKVTLSARAGSLTLAIGDKHISLGPSATLRRGETGSAGMTFITPALSNRFCGDLCLTASGDSISAVLRIYIEDYLYGETKGMLAFYGDTPATCYFCDSNGGQTESSANAFDATLPYSVVMDDPYDLEGGVRKTATLREDAADLDVHLRAALDAGIAEQLARQGLNPEGAQIIAIEAIQPEDPRFDAPSKLYRSLAFALAVETGSGAETTVTVHIPTYGALEQWYDLSINDEDNETVWVTHIDQAFEISFRRKGYGVGMSQRGAQAMARKGLSCETILEYYYPGISLRRERLTDKSIGNAEDVTAASPTAQAIATARLKQKTRLYESADDTGAARTTLPAGASTTVYAVRGEWAAISSGKLYGFIHTDALTSFALTGVTAAQVQGEAYARVSGGPAEILQLPVKTALVIETLPAGTQVRLNAYSDKWALITTAADVEGFIPRSALTLQGSEAAANAGDVITAQDNLYGLLTEQASLYVNTDDSVSPLLTLEKDARVRILAYNDTWAQVRTADGATGFVKLTSLSAVQQVNAPERAEIEGGDIIVLKNKPYRYVSVDALSLFKSYSTDADILTTLKAGEKVRLGAYNDKWACVRARGITGYVLRSGLSDTPPQRDTVKGKRFATVISDKAPLYPSWSESDAPLTHLDRGTQVQLGAYNGAWACVNADGVMGYMRIDTLELTEARPVEASGVNYLECDATTTVDAALYRSADLDGTPLASVPKGTSVHVYAFNDRCAYVDCAGQRGFMALRYLKKAG